MRGLALVGAVVLVGLLVYRQFDRWRGDVVTVWVAAAELETGTELTPEHLAPVRLRQRSIPPGAVVDQAKIAGTELLRPKPPGATFLRGDLRRRPPSPGLGLAGSVPEGRVMMPYSLPGFPIAELADMLRQGDHLDIFSYRRGEPLHIARDAIFMAWIRPPAPAGNGNGNGGGGGTLVSSLNEAMDDARPSRPTRPRSTPLLLGVRPEDVRRLVWAKNSGLPLTAVLHGRAEVDEGTLLNFPAEPRPRAAEIEVILGASRVRQPLQNLR